MTQWIVLLSIISGLIIWWCIQYSSRSRAFCCVLKMPFRTWSSATPDHRGTTPACSHVAFPSVTIRGTDAHLCHEKRQSSRGIVAQIANVSLRQDSGRMDSWKPTGHEYDYAIRPKQVNSVKCERVVLLGIWYQRYASHFWKSGLCDCFPVGFLGSPHVCTSF
jgi:hypothetical protein